MSLHICTAQVTNHDLYLYLCCLLAVKTLAYCKSADLTSWWWSSGADAWSGQRQRAWNTRGPPPATVKRAPMTRARLDFVARNLSSASEIVFVVPNACCCLIVSAAASFACRLR